MNLTLHHISKRFTTLRGTVNAVRNISLHIRDGEFFVLLGPSGCGKSTLLNLVAGLEKLSEGEIRFDQETVADARTKVFLSPRSRNVAMVFQSYALYPHLNIFDNIGFPLRVTKNSPPVVQSAVQSTAQMLDIENLLQRKPAELSGGQRQRVAIARAIVRRPRLFLLDEPLSNLDAQLRTRMRLELKNLQRKLNITTLYVTHDQTEAMTLGDRIALLRNGSLIQTGTPEEMYAQPRDPFAATFIGSPPMNLIPGKMTQTQEGRVASVFGDRLRLPLRSMNFRQEPDSDEILLGIRPEHIALKTRNGDQSLTTRVSAIEPLGREVLLHLDSDEGDLTALSDKKHYRIGQTISVSFDTDHIHIFEKEGNHAEREKKNDPQVD
jgi:multiple sugar transport system ATP-binding protein